MGIFNPIDGSCQKCGRPAREAKPGERWHAHDWVCRHNPTIECPDCYDKSEQTRIGFASCPVCGQQVEFT